MTDDQHELRGINWGETFQFAHVFKSWRMSIQPSNMLLALAVILSVYAFGRILDGFWCAAGQTAIPGEIGAYAVLGPAPFDSQKQGWQRTRPDRAASLAVEARGEERSLGQAASWLGGGRLSTIFREQLSASNAQRTAPAGPTYDQLRQQAQENWKGVLRQARRSFAAEIDRTQELLRASHKQARQQVQQLPDDQRESAKDQLEAEYEAAQRALTARKMDFDKQARLVRGQGIFEGLMLFESAAVRGATQAVMQGDIVSGLREHLSRPRSVLSGVPAEGVLPVAPAAPGRPGVLYFVVLAWSGVCWLITQHWVYALIFLSLSLLAWAVLGGAMYRVAALRATRDERISIFNALRYSGGKLFSFFAAPLIPLAIIVVLGLLLTVLALLGNLGGGVGALLLGAFFFGAIAVGLLIAFLTIGLAAGVSLMYPTIAVEGSDCLDAISRSFSYVFSRPWRAILYAMVTMVYGTLCYLFVRLFAFLALLGAHTFVGWGVFTGGGQVSPQADRLDVLWPAPTFEQFYGGVPWAALSGAEYVGAVLMAVWVCLVVAAVAAFGLSLLASSTTVIYLLLRRHVDATDLNDAWVEEGAQDALPPQAEPPPTAAAEPPPPATPPAPPAPV
jgi:hypothetical protein